MAHAGKEIVFRLVEFFDFFFLLDGNFVFLLVKVILKQKQSAGQSSCKNDGTCGVKIGLCRGVCHYIFRIMVCNIIAK